MRFALVTDIHFGPAAYFAGKLRKLTHEAERLTRAFVARMNGVEQPDLVINLGDVVEDQSRDADLANYSKFIGLMSELEARVLHVAGNHDTINLSHEELCGLWGHGAGLHYSCDFEGVHLVVLHTNEVKDTAVHLAEHQLEWLVQDLERATYPTLVFMHHPASELELGGNRWFENAPHICRVAERRRLRSLLEASGKVVAVFNGHVHWNHFDVISGIPYVTLQSLTENLDDDAPGRASMAWAVCDLDSHRLAIRVFGEEPIRYQLELARR